MAKAIKIILVTCICIIVPRFASRSQAITGTGEQRKNWFQTSRLYVGIREKTNRNDHDSIAVFNRFARVPVNSPYCAAGLNYTAYRSGLRFNIKNPAGVRFWFIQKSIIWSRQNKRFLMPPQLMDVVWIFGSHVEAIGQASIKRDIEDTDKFVTIGFNTGGNTGRQGVHFPIERRWRDVRFVANPFLLNN